MSAVEMVTAAAESLLISAAGSSGSPSITDIRRAKTANIIVSACNAVDNRYYPHRSWRTDLSLVSVMLKLFRKEVRLSAS